LVNPPPPWRWRGYNDLVHADEYGEYDQEYDGVSGTESIGEVIVVLRTSLRSFRHHSDDLVHLPAPLNATSVLQLIQSSSTEKTPCPRKHWLFCMTDKQSK